MLIPSILDRVIHQLTSLSRRVNANSQRNHGLFWGDYKLIKKGEC